MLKDLPALNIVVHLNKTAKFKCEISIGFAKLDLATLDDGRVGKPTHLQFIFY